MSKKVFVSTPIYYPNSNLHIGHAYTTVLADAYARWKKLEGCEVYFLTGSDEHGQKIENKAKENNEDALTYVTKIVKNFKLLWEKLDVDYDHFVRTTDQNHIKYVQQSFTKLLENDKIYKGNYKGKYCTFDEAFFTEFQLNNGLCPECGREVTDISEESYFLKISEEKDWIKKQLEGGELLFPKYRVGELVNNFVNDLKDLSISRKTFSWGIPIKEDPKHVIYVWLDALQNYISTLTYPNSKWTPEEVWGKDSDVEIVQIIGKEITRFHAIYWPIILKLLGYRTPTIYAHGWLITDKNEKMSKSKGNVIEPIELIDKYGKDIIRFYLLNNIQTGEDGIYSEKLLINTFNSILVNKYSNLISRTQSMIEQNFNRVVPGIKTYSKDFEEMDKELKQMELSIFENMKKINISSATKLIIQYIEKLNNFIDVTKTWLQKGDRLGDILSYLITKIANATLFLSPFLVDKTKEVLDWLGLNNPSFKDLEHDFKNVKLKKLNHLYERIK